MTKQEFTQKMEFSKDVKDLPMMFCIQKEYIASLESQNATLTADNLSLVEQVNECGVKYEKLVGVMNMALSDVDDGGYVRAGARLRKWKMEQGGQDA